MALYLRDPLEGRRHDGDVEMAAFTCTGVTGVLGAVVANLQHGGVQRLFERGAQSLDAGAHADGFRRMIQNTIPSVNTNTNGITTKVLKLTQTSWLIVNAIHRLAAPSAQ